MTDTTSDDVVERCGSLVRLASASDSPGCLVVAASRALDRPLVLLDTRGALLVASPQATCLDRSVEALGAAAAGRHPAPAGWRVLPVTRDGEDLAVLAVCEVGAGAPRGMLDLVLSLLGEQFVRSALTSAVRDQRRTALARRIVTDESIAPGDIHAEARAADLQLADLYWPALLVWAVGHPGPRTLAELHGWAQHLPGTIVVPLGNTTITLLIAARSAGDPHRETVHGELGRLVCRARHLGHRDVHAIVDEQSVGVTEIPARVRLLQRLRRFLPHASGPAPVRCVRSFALDCLLTDGLDRHRAEDFLRRRLCRLLQHDLDHGTDLARVLELALDFPRRDDAAHAGYMHRNTFRRRLGEALDLVGSDLSDPDDRLGLHVALKLRRLLGTPQQTGAPRHGTDVRAPREKEQRWGAAAVAR